jgi:hypothetical protein
VIYIIKKKIYSIIILLRINQSWMWSIILINWTLMICIRVPAYVFFVVSDSRHVRNGDVNLSRVKFHFNLSQNI